MAIGNAKIIQWVSFRYSIAFRIVGSKKQGTGKTIEKRKTLAFE